MKTTARTRIALLVAPAACLAAAAPAARGGLFASLSYDHFFSLTEPLGGSGPRNAEATLVGTTLPVQKTETLAQSFTAGSAAYAFTDDGTTAALTIDCQGQISGSPNCDRGRRGRWR